MFGLDHRAMNPLTGKIHRIHIKPDEKVPDAVVFDIWLEDHTMGNALRMELLRNEQVLFCGYKVPHPYNNMIELRVQTLPQTTPEAAVRSAVRNLRTEFKSMLEQFDESVAEVQEAQAKKEGAVYAALHRLRDDDLQNVLDGEVADDGDDGLGRRFDDEVGRLGAGPESEHSPDFSPSSPADSPEEALTHATTSPAAPPTSPHA